MPDRHYEYFSFRGLYLRLDELIGFAQFLESLIVGMGCKGKLNLKLHIGDRRAKELSDSKKLKDTLDRVGLKNLRQVHFSLDSNALAINFEAIDSVFGGYKLEITAETEEKVLATQETIKTLLTKRNNANWLAGSVWSLALVAGSILAVYSFFAILGILHVSVLGKYVWQLVILGVLVTVTLTTVAMCLMSRKYPTLLVTDQQGDANGKDLKMSLSKIVGWSVGVAIPLGLSIMEHFA